MQIHWIACRPMGLNTDDQTYGELILSSDRQASVFNPSGLAAHGTICNPAGLKTMGIRR